MTGKGIMKILKSLFVLLFFISLASPVNAQMNSVYIDGLNSNQIKNIEAKIMLNKLVLDKMKLDNQLSMRSTNLMTLNDVIQIANTNTELVEVYKYQDNLVSDRIMFDSFYNVYILLEEDHVESTSTLTIDNTTFEIKSENIGRISFVDYKGIELVIYEEVIDQNSSEQINQFNRIYSTTQIAPRAASWINKSGPFHKTSKMNFEVLSWVGTVASGLTLTVTGPLGTVLFIYGLAVSIGQTISPTIHIQFYLENRSDCLSYHRETRYYFGAYSEISGQFYERINNSNGTAKSTYALYHSINPIQIGGSCLNYN